LRLDLAADSAGAGLWSMDVKTGRIWATDRTLLMFGYAPGDEIDVKKFYAIVHPEDRDRITRTVDTAVRDKKAISDQYRITLPDGSIRWIAVKGNIQVNPLGETVSLLGATMDITERKKMEQDLQEKRIELTHVARVSTMGQLASTLAHELNQPLGAILRNAEAAELFLQDPSPDLDELRAILADIRKDDQRAGVVIDRMRAMIRQRKAERCRLDLNLLVDEVVVLVKSDADKRHVRLAMDVAPSLPPVHGDGVQLQQVLVNLLLNAFDALDENLVDKRLVTVSMQTVGATVEVAVSDNGPGIAKDKFPHFFAPFFTTKSEGLGMGLAISRSIIEEHGGRLWADNNEAGGATFTFSLPVMIGAAA